VGDEEERLRRKRNQMSVAELQELEEVKGLITRGQQVGVLTYAEIATATAELGAAAIRGGCRVKVWWRDARGRVDVVVAAGRGVSAPAGRFQALATSSTHARAIPPSGRIVAVTIGSRWEKSPRLDGDLGGEHDVVLVDGCLDVVSLEGPPGVGTHASCTKS
jgi:hypothetical protein